MTSSPCPHDADCKGSSVSHRFTLRSVQSRGREPHRKDSGRQDTRVSIWAMPEGDADGWKGVAGTDSSELSSELSSSTFCRVGE